MHEKMKKSLLCKKSVCAWPPTPAPVAVAHGRGGAVQGSIHPKNDFRCNFRSPKTCFVKEVLGKRFINLGNINFINLYHFFTSLTSIVSTT